MATPAMNESWRSLRDQIKGIWSDTEFNDRNMRRTRGSLQKMVNLVHDRTGEPRTEVRRKITALL
ncbi:MAG: general stress protein CsbD [Bacteroidota bacterium]